MNEDIILKLLKSPCIEDIVIGLNYLSKLEESAIKQFLGRHSIKRQDNNSYLAYVGIVKSYTEGIIRYIARDHIMLAFTTMHIYILGETYRRVVKNLPDLWENVTI